MFFDVEGPENEKPSLIESKYPYTKLSTALADFQTVLQERRQVLKERQRLKLKEPKILAIQELANGLKKFNPAAKGRLILSEALETLKTAIEGKLIRGKANLVVEAGQEDCADGNSEINEIDEILEVIEKFDVESRL